MPSGQDSSGDELDIQVTPETESADDTQNSGSAESESTEELNLETETVETDKVTPQEANAKAQEEAWLGKIIAGKVEVEDAPNWLQKRLTNRLEATSKTPETEEVVKKVLAQEREAQEFKTLQKQIPPLSSAQAKELTARFAELKPLGNVKALETALKLMGLDSKVREAEARGIAKGRVSFPASGLSSVRKAGEIKGGVPVDIINDDKKWNEMIRKGSGT